jgi:hypothetical protein
MEGATLELFAKNGWNFRMSVCECLGWEFSYSKKIKKKLHGVPEMYSILSV